MLALALQTAAAFSLLCSGTVRTGPLGLALPEEDGTPIAVDYRIDLDAGLWCSQACDMPERLDSVIEGVIVLRDRHHPTRSSVIMINPAAGRFSDTMIEGNIATLTSGTCRLAPFDGFRDRIA